jgi:D-glycero-alpha-D-manno-heptose-7-phosphate kinase
MIITKTPYRLSFFGGGTDYPDWFKENGGQVLSTSINRYLYISCRYLPPFFDHKIRLVYSETEEKQDASQFDHPSAREVLRFLNIKDGLEIHYDGDLPGRSGTGSSSAFTVGLLNALYTYKGIKASPNQLAQEAIHIEQDLIKETVGSQDQVAVSYGGFNKITFSGKNNFEVFPVDISEKRLKSIESRLMLFFTGINRTAEKIAKTYVENISKKEAQLNLMSRMVDKGLDIATKGEIDDFGHLLDEAWKKKRELSEAVTNNSIDEIYETAINAGALGGKISGAGGGGFMVFFVPKEKQEKVKKKLSKLINVPFRFEKSGSTAIFQE